MSSMLGGVINGCVDKEREALLHFKASIEDPGDLLSNWSGEDDCCLWTGVGCDPETGHVIELQFNTMRIINSVNFSRLVGEISPSLVNLTHLNRLDLSDNSFNGTIPSFIGSMTNLSYLSLGQNSFRGIIPREFGNLTNLKLLGLGQVGRCTVENIDWLSNLSSLLLLDMSGISLANANHWVNVISSLEGLIRLDLRDCDLSQVMYPYSSSFLNASSSSIATLDLQSNNLNSSMYSWLFPLTSQNLKYLQLSHNVLDGIPKYLGNLCKLTELYLSENSAVVNFSSFLNDLSSGCTPLTLAALDVSSNQFTGSLSDEIQKFSSLKILNLSHNQLDGTISNKLWELPVLYLLDVSYNSFISVGSEHNGTSTISSIDMSSCKLGPPFPQMIPNLYLNRLDISNNRISDAIPVGFWNMWHSQLYYLNLSFNNISGEAPDLSSNFRPEYSVIDLSTNNFSGPILNASSSLVSLDLSNNKFDGGLLFLCQIHDGLTFLDLSHNSFTGQLPDCLWHFKKLIVLNLGDNNLSRRLPNSLGSLVQLEVLHLHGNKFSGELPLSLKNCTNLKFLNLGANRFSGNVPVWIGENLSRLYGLSLGSNNFFGAIPLEICQLANLQILDLSMNDLYGTIPRCLNNFTFMVSKGFSFDENVHSYWSGMTFFYSIGGAYVDHAMIQWQGTGREFTNNLRFLRSIDLSSNNLTGQIPNEFSALHELVALNLSMNALIGEIPRNISEMKELIVLDLSKNSFSGRLPSSMSEMSRLGYLDVSYNNLSGRIPSSTQLQSFEPSRYAGNTNLCGAPITKYCPGDAGSEISPVMEGDGESDDELERWFYIGGAVGLATGFWITCSVLLLNNRGSVAFFHFLDSSKDWIQVKMMVFITKW